MPDMSGSTVMTTRALACRGELAIRLDRPPLARTSLDEIEGLDLEEKKRASLADEMEHVEAFLR